MLPRREVIHVYLALAFFVQIAISITWVVTAGKGLTYLNVAFRRWAVWRTYLHGESHGLSDLGRVRLRTKCHDRRNNLVHLLDKYRRGAAIEIRITFIGCSDGVLARAQGLALIGLADKVVTVVENSVAVWPAMGIVAGPSVNDFAAGSYSSVAPVTINSSVRPPAMNTSPFGKSVAECRI